MEAIAELKSPSSEVLKYCQEYQSLQEGRGNCCLIRITQCIIMPRKLQIFSDTMDDRKSQEVCCGRQQEVNSQDGGRLDNFKCLP